MERSISQFLRQCRVTWRDSYQWQRMTGFHWSGRMRDSRHTRTSQETACDLNEGWSHTWKHTCVHIYIGSSKKKYLHKNQPHLLKSREDPHRPARSQHTEPPQSTSDSFIPCQTRDADPPMPQVTEMTTLFTTALNLSLSSYVTSITALKLKFFFKKKDELGAIVPAGMGTHALRILGRVVELPWRSHGHGRGRERAHVEKGRSKTCG